MTFVFWIIFAVLTALVANAKKRNVPGWLVLGLLFGFIALVLVAVLPNLDNEK